MSTVTSLNSYSFAFNGFVFGGAGSPYQITNVTGLSGLPTIANQDDNRGYADGMFTGPVSYTHLTLPTIYSV